MAGSDYKWRLSTGGDVGVAANWSPYTNGSPGTMPPGAADEAEFAGLGGTITGTITVAQWQIDSGAGLYTFAGHTTATFFQVDTSATLTGSWTQTGAGDVAIGITGSGALSETNGASLSATALALATHAGASGTLDLSGGATATVSGITAIGAAAGGSGATVDLDAATLTAKDQVQVGLQSGGTLVVHDGGLLASGATLAHPFLVAGGAGSTGTVEVEGAGTALNAGSNQIEIGAGGTGGLTLQGGAGLTAGGLFLAAGGTGTADLTGAGTTAAIGSGGVGIGEGGTGLVTLEHGAAMTVAGGLDVGVGGTGTLDIETGAALTSAGAAIGVRTSANVPGAGTMRLDAAEWQSSGQIQVGAGKGGTATLQVEDGATLQASATLAASVPFLYVDEDSTGHAGVDIGGATTVLDAGSNGVVVGATGFGALTVHDGAVLDAGSTGTLAAFVLGAQSGGAGSATLSGAASQIDVTGSAVVGAGGTGVLTVGGAFTVSGNLQVGADSTASGTVSVEDGGDVAVGGRLAIGGGASAGGTGSVALASGGTLTAGTLLLYAGGTLTVDGTGSAEIGTAGDGVAGQLVVDAGVTAGGSGVIAAAVTNHGDLVAQAGTLTVTGQASGDGSYDIAAGATFDLAAPGDVKIRFLDNTGTAILGSASGSASLLHFAGQDTLRMVGIGANAEVTYAGHTATVAGSLGSWTFTFAAAPPDLQLTMQGNDALVVACYAEGTSIATPGGSRLIEDLDVGDLVVTAAGKVRPITWMGRRVVQCRHHPAPRRVWPVRIAPHAFGPGLPARPLFLSPDHAVFTDGVLIPVRYLVDGEAIRQVALPAIAYWHLALDTHDVVLAEGLPAESFLGDRDEFGQMGDTVSLRWEAEGCAPLVVTGPILEAVRARLARHAREQPGMTVAA